MRRSNQNQQQQEQQQEQPQTSAARKPRQRDGNHLSVRLIDKHEHCASLTPDLSSMILPLDRETFLHDFHQQRRALAVKVHPSHRAERLSFLKSLMFDLKPRDMLHNSLSEADGISVWMATEQGNKSMKVKPEEAILCYQSGHSLYFRNNEEVESAFIPALLQQIYGHGLSFYRDGSRRGECEVFASHGGHPPTDWHFDFQDSNFTIQLRGRKKWYLYKSDIDYPYRANAHHFANDKTGRAVLRTQNAIAAVNLQGSTSATASSGGGDAPLELPEDLEQNCETVILEPGDFLFFPSGMLHKVETLETEDGENSLSCNFSLFPISGAEFLQEAISTLSQRNSHLRRPMMMTPELDNQKMAENLLGHLKSELNLLSGGHLLPSVMLPNQTVSTKRLLLLAEKKKNNNNKMKNQDNENEDQDEDEDDEDDEDEDEIEEFEIPRQVTFDGKQRILNIKPSLTTASFAKLLSAVVQPDTMLRRNPIAVLFELPSRLDESDSEQDDSSSDEDDDDFSDDLEEEDEEGDIQDDDGDDDDESSSSSEEEESEKAQQKHQHQEPMTVFDLVSNFISDEQNFGAPAIRIKVRVPTSLRETLKKLSRVQPEILVRASSLGCDSREKGDLLKFLVGVGFFAVVQADLLRSPRLEPKVQPRMKELAL